MKPFAKLYETERGQVLVMRQAGDEGPEIAFHFYPGVDGLGLCQFKIGYRDDEDGESKADAVFDEITQERAVSMVRKAMSGIESTFGEAP